MNEFLASLVWLGGLALAVGAAEGLVRTLTLLGDRFHFSVGLLGLLVALGADGPEVTSALVASIQGKHDVGLGVVLGSNIYNLAGLLGLSAVLAGYVYTGKRFVGPSEALNLGLCLLLVAVLFAPAAHLPVGILLLLSILIYTAIISVHSAGTAPESARAESPALGLSTSLLVLLTVSAAGLIVAGSDALVQSSTYLGPRMGIPSSVVGTFVLAVSTSLPNTWAAISLARRRLSAEAIATTFNSNSINIAVGLGAPSLVVALHESFALSLLDFSWLLGMTLVAVLMLAFRPALSRVEGSLLIALYVAFAIVRIGMFR